MVTIQPVSRALVPRDTDAANRLTAPNYDEFQSDREVWELLQKRPECVLRITMAHCHVPEIAGILPDGGPQALEHSVSEMQALQNGPLVQSLNDILWVYEVVSPRRPDIRQIGLGGFGRTAEIRTEQQPNGTIIRNEGIHPDKAEGRARLIRATRAYIGTVNCAVRDESGRFVTALDTIADARPCDYEAIDEAGNRHRTWLVTDATQIAELQALLANEPAAYVADGNHRSAAAAALGEEHFLAVFFPTGRMHLEPYNRLLPSLGQSPESLLSKLAVNFEIEALGPIPEFRPEQIHEIGLYLAGEWHLLRPWPGTFDPESAADSIDAAIVHKHIVQGVLGVSDARDKRLNYVGGNKDSRYLKSRVDAGDYALALSLAPVTMEQFGDVCEQNQFMPPKSTWFDPKIRSGMVMALLE
ncbi:MAG: DUF1015 domain-containing protein [Planctomycetaceae bacterium]|nr:DUF1015 domain-containing protein [Planctomycetaceae bacterium]